MKKNNVLDCSINENAKKGPPAFKIFGITFGVVVVGVNTLVGFLLGLWIFSNGVLLWPASMTVLNWLVFDTVHERNG